MFSPRSALVLAALLALMQPAGPAAAQSTPADSALLVLLRRANPELTARRSEVAAAEARLRATGFATPAVLSAEAEEIPGGIDVTSATLRVSLEREILPRGLSSAQRELRSAEVRAAEARTQLTEQRLLAQARRALLRWGAGAQIARRLAAEDSLLSGAEAALRARFSVGEARYVDVLRLRTERLRVQSERAEALTTAAAGRRALQTLLGGADAGDLTAPTPGDTLPAAPDVEALLAASGALRLADAGVERARAARALTAAELRPRITVSAGAQRFEGEDGSQQLGPSLGASVTLPGTARRAGRTAIQAAEADVAAAQAARTAAEAEIRGALLAARDRYEAARARLALLDAALLRGARQEREAALAAFGSGELSLVELIDFERALSRAELERVRARLDAADALADLYSAAAGSPGETTSSSAGTDDDR